MLEQLFKDVYVRERLLASPMGTYLDVLSSKLLQLSYSHAQARKLIRTASSLGLWLAEQGLAPADAGKKELLAYMEKHKRTPAGRLPEGAIGFSRLPLLLESEGILCKPKPESPADPWLRRFHDYELNVCGVTSTTEESYRYYVEPLILGLCRDGQLDWSCLTAEYITDFVVRETGAARAAKGRIVTAIRTFLRFLVAEGVVPAQLCRAIPRVRRWRYADIPKRLSADQLALALKACQSEKYGSLRDRAFIALLARLGVRSGELRKLRLEDIDWAEGLIHIRQSKSGRGRTLPLPDDAGALLVRYLRDERPATQFREVFLTSVTPRRPLGECVTTTFVKIFLKKLDLDGPGRGSHSFRHTAATLMAQNGASLKEVADVLGHRCLASTGIYVKLDEPSLREVAMPWTGGDV
jgi:integrase/recombinase XerD